MKDFLQPFAEADRPRLLVVGDLMLDRYTIGNVGRISPEAPVPVLTHESEEVRAGGAANVATLLRGLEADVSAIGVIGRDHGGRVLQQILQENGVGCRDVIALMNRPTTVKHRFVGRTGHKQPHQILRVDQECCHPLPSPIKKQITRTVVAQIDGCQAVVLSDYAKGVMDPKLVRTIIEECRRREIPVLVDPSRHANWSAYRGAAAITPNRLAVETYYGCQLRTPDSILAAAERLQHDLEVEAVVITLDRDGLAFATASERGMIEAYPRDVCDVAGAGDMVLAVLSFCRALKLAWREGLGFANTAAGLEVERFGVQPVSRAEIAEERSSRHTQRKLVTLEELGLIAAGHRRAGRSLVFTNGCFDLLHAGHVGLLEEAATLGDVLVVAINTDASVRRLKGPARPVIGELDRARLLAALGCVDHVVVFEEDTPQRLLERLRPDTLVKGGTTADIVGRAFVEGYGGRVIRLDAVPGHSTTNIVNRCYSTQSAPLGEAPLALEQA